jgi:chemotaxis protein CheD
MIPAEGGPNDCTPVTHVRIGELRTAKFGILKATLGSCVAIALIDRREGLCGLAHCFLPVAPEGYVGRDARYADRAAANLLQKVAPDASAHRKLRAFIAGGGRLLSQEVSSRLQVGTANVEAVRAGLRGLGIRFKEIEIGGAQGCNAVLDCNNFTFTCEKIGDMLIGDRE